MEFAIGVIASIASLVIGTLFGAELSRFLYKPKVLIRYKDILPLDLETGTFWSLRVENRGRSVAENCIGVISISGLGPDDMLHEHEADTAEDLPSFEEGLSESFPRKQILNPTYFRKIDTASLCWSKLGNPDSIDINPGVSRSLDLCKFHKSENGCYFIFPSEFGWKTIRLRSRARKIEGEIRICPSNEFPTTIEFTLSYDDDGQSALVCKPKPLAKKIASRISRQ